ncbi:MAG: class I SAM-dependent methyltransferase [Nitrospinota bacterium]|nr:class I SAM-dependent methyltransferase [Nitrospinota bacterium]
MEHPQLNLHDQRYMDRLLAKESYSRIGQLLKLIELKRDLTVADFACGNGVMLEFLHEKVGKYFGIDFSPSAIKNAELRKKKMGVTNAQFFCDSIQSFCYKNQEKFDIAMAFDFSEHVGDKEWLQILSSIKNSLKKGGKLYMHTPNGKYVIEIMKNKNFIFKQFPEHISVRSAQKNTILLEKAGYQIRCIKFLSHYNILKYIHLLSFIPWLGSYFQARLFIIAEKV